MKVIRIDTNKEITGKYKKMIIEADKIGKSLVVIEGLKIIIKSSCKNKKLIKIAVV